MTKECSNCGREIPSVAKQCPECGSFLDWRRFLSLGNLILASFSAFVLFALTQLPSMFALVAGLFPSDAKLAFRVTEAPSFEAKVTNYGNSETNEEFSTIRYHLKLPVHIHNQTGTEILLDKVVATVLMGSGVRSFKNSTELSAIAPNSSLATDVWLPITLEKFDPAFKGWRVERMSFDAEIQEDFGTLRTELFAFDESGSSYEVDSFTFEIGNISVPRRP
ncbi:MAG: zinc ribbon domain-containing protein [Pseudomonadota bacterium]